MRALAALIAAGLAAGAANAYADGGKALAPHAIEAHALARSYTPGETARIEILGETNGLHVALFHSGLETSNSMSNDDLLGTPVAARISASAHTASIPVGNWQSGLYFVRVTSSAGHAFAPFVVRPRRLGEHRIAVVLPTNTWQAYNVRDANRDGVGDTWYADPRLSVDLERPFGKNGVPPHFAQYDLLFVRWLARTDKQVDMLTDDDLESISARALSRAYDLVVFSGHHEYVTTHEYDVVETYRNRGGNLMFLSANNFFYRVVRTGTTLHRVGRWRDLGRPEAALVGIQYLDWNHDEWGNAGYRVLTNGWPFAGTGLRRGARFGTYGIEIDAPTKDSPAGLRVLASVPNLFGKGRSAEMTYYTTPSGAKVFAAGTINFGGTAVWQPASRVLQNIWDALAQP
jgi:N,N-dimethylformamidase